MMFFLFLFKVNTVNRIKKMLPNLFQKHYQSSALYYIIADFFNGCANLISGDFGFIKLTDDGAGFGIRLYLFHSIHLR